MKRFKNILCVLEPAIESSAALERAVTLAENNQASLTAVIVAPPTSASIGMPDGGSVSAELRTAVISRHQENLADAVEPYRHRISIETKVLIGTPFLEIIREVLRSGHDMVIKAPETLDWLDRLFSSNDKHLLRKCPCPVWMVRPHTGDSFNGILACVDVGDGYPAEELKARQALNRMVMELASSLSVSEFADMHVAHAWEAVGESSMRDGAFTQRPESEVNSYVEQIREHNTGLLDQFIEQTSNDLGADLADYVKPQLHLPKGSARKIIPRLAKELGVDCVVMGTVARTGIPGFFMGNTAETILDQLTCSVLAVKPPGFETPVTVE